MRESEQVIRKVGQNCNGSDCSFFVHCTKAFARDIKEVCRNLEANMVKYFKEATHK